MPLTIDLPKVRENFSTFLIIIEPIVRMSGNKYAITAFEVVKLYGSKSWVWEAIEDILQLAGQVPQDEQLKVILAKLAS